MTNGTTRAVVVDTMVVSSLINAARQPETASEYSELIEARPVVVSFATVTELRYGAMKAGWGDLRRRALERDLARFVVVQPDDQQMSVCAELRATCEVAAHPLGQKIHEADRWIAATAIRLRVELISDDHVFENIEQLTVTPHTTHTAARASTWSSSGQRRDDRNSDEESHLDGHPSMEARSRDPRQRRLDRCRFGDETVPCQLVPRPRELDQRGRRPSQPASNQRSDTDERHDEAEHPPTSRTAPTLRSDDGSEAQARTTNPKRPATALA